MTEEIRQVLLGMKSRLSEDWTQGDMFAKGTNSLGRGGCVFGVAVQNGLVCGDVVRAFRTGEPKMSIAGRSGEGDGPTFQLDTGTPTWAALKLIATAVEVPVSQLALWNDDPDRTAEDVVEAIDRALAALPVAEEVPA